MRILIYISALFLATAVAGCKHEPTPTPDTPTAATYPERIQTIMQNRCATAGCHNAASYKATGGLLLDTWEHLFDGSTNGAVIVPYNTENSSLLYFINTYPELGTTNEPVMPYNSDPLTRDEYLMVKEWIENGAPDINGNIPFANDANSRQKIYSVQQGCDLVAVIDAEKQVLMRYISVGINYGTENPNNIVISPDGNYAYVSFWNASIIQKIDTRTDSVVATLEMPRRLQKSITLNAAGTKLLACNWYTQDLLLIDANSMTIEKDLGKNIKFIGGMTATNNGFYATSQFGNTVYKVREDGSYDAISIDGQPLTLETSAGTPDPYKIAMSPGKDKYFITCSNTDELRILDAGSNKLISAIPVGHNPQEIAVSTSQPYVFVSCMNDTLGALEVGSIYVINYQTNEVVKKITKGFFQPYGVAVDDKNGLLYVFNRNEDKNGPPPHHSSPCNGRNGFYQVFDINTFEPYNNRRYEVSVNPYSAAARF